MVITPTLTYRSGTWTVPHEHEKLIRSQHKMLRLIVQTKRKYKTKSKKEVTTKNSRTMKEANRIRQQTRTKERIQDVIKDSSVSFQSDLDDDMDTAEVEEEEWIEYIKRSTRSAEEKMRTASIPCWIEAQRKWSGDWQRESFQTPEERLTEKQQHGIQVLASRQKKQQKSRKTKDKMGG